MSATSLKEPMKLEIRFRPQSTRIRLEAGFCDDPKQTLKFDVGRLLLVWRHEICDVIDVDIMNSFQYQLFAQYFRLLCNTRQ